MSAIAAFDACPHEKTILTRRYFSQGWHFTRQCLKCWDKVGNWIKKEVAEKEVQYIDDVPLFNLEARERVQNEAWAFKKEEGDLRRAERRRLYEEYINSDAWRAKRSLVRDRSRGLCEGCRMAPLEEVHHLTYVHFGAEFLWELAAVCKPCHDRFHNQ